MEFSETLTQVAEAIREADALIIAVGAGMGVDSGLPDFRGVEGFWRAYPPLAKLGIPFEEIANPEWFVKDPLLAWGFYGHRLNLYRNTTPHKGFDLLRQWVSEKLGGAFIYTSNVDGQFQKAGFDPARIVECHGSIHYLQCLYYCTREIWPAEKEILTVNEATLQAEHPLPRCPHCGNLARPNLLMFNDWHWLEGRSAGQEERWGAWLEDVLTAEQRICIIEIGAGRSIPSVRRFSERCQDKLGVTLIRINPRESQGPPGTLSLPLGGLEALEQLATRLEKR